MVRRRSAAVLAVALLSLGGCGGSGDPGHGKPQTITPAGVLLSTRDPGDGAVEGRAVPMRQRLAAAALCDAAAALRRAGASVAESRALTVAGQEVKQVVGVFPTPSSARRAFSSLASPRQRDCIVASLRRFAPRGFAGYGASALPLLELGVGDEATLMRFEIASSGRWKPPLVDAYPVRVGRVLTDLALVSPQPESLDRLAAETAEAAAKKMKAAQG